MQLQDELWLDEVEDPQLMSTLHFAIIDEAIDKGFKGAYNLYITDGEALVEIFESEEHKEQAILGKLKDIDCFGRCESLILHLEKILLEAGQLDRITKSLTDGLSEYENKEKFQTVINKLREIKEEEDLTLEELDDQCWDDSNEMLDKIWQ